MEASAHPSRRETIVDGTVALLRAGGPREVTHRRVAQAASVPLAATTYYFASKAELLEEALDRVARQEVDHLVALADRLDELLIAGADPLSATAGLVAGALAHQYASVAVKFEVYLEAYRHPALRPACARWAEAFRALAERALGRVGAADPPARAPLLVAGIDGLLLQRLAAGAPELDADAFAAQVEALLAGLAA